MLLTRESARREIAESFHPTASMPDTVVTALVPDDFDDYFDEHSIDGQYIHSDHLIPLMRDGDCAHRDHFD